MSCEESEEKRSFAYVFSGSTKQIAREQPTEGDAIFGPQPRCSIAK
jgi:hypothetical protein